MKEEPSLAFETELVAISGVSHVIGVDEVGRGCLAGDVFSGAVCFRSKVYSSHESAQEIYKSHPWLRAIKDSKLLTRMARKYLYGELTGRLDVEQLGADVAFSLGRASSAEIDQINILQATFLSMARAIVGLLMQPFMKATTPDDVIAVIVDGKLPLSPFAWVKAWEEVGISDPPKLLSKPKIKADASCLSVAVASVLAKEARDIYAETLLESAYPGYGFAKHKGYGTKAHLQALNKLGPTHVHRYSFSPVARLKNQSL